MPKADRRRSLRVGQEGSAGSAGHGLGRGAGEAAETGRDEPGAAKLTLAARRAGRRRSDAVREEALRRQNLRFDAALRHMSQGLCMFDADWRVTVCNARYLEIMGLTDEVVKPGATLRDLIAHGVALGCIPGAPSTSCSPSARPSCRGGRRPA